MKKTSPILSLKPLALVVAGSTLLGSGVTHAQSLVLEEVVVTAQKRSESLQDVAATNTAIQGEALQ